MKLLTIENAKTTKGEALGVLTGILYLAPSDVSGFNVCAMALPMGAEPDGIRSTCSATCLFTAGMGSFPNVQAARIAKTRRYFEDREAFMADIRADIRALVRRAARLGFTPAVRLDGTSDLGLARELAPLFPEVQFYDYTKILKRALDPTRPGNLHLTFSASEVTDVPTLRRVLDHGVNVAVVFNIRKGAALPERYLGAPVIDGDEHDARFLDAPLGADAAGIVVGLRAKGAARTAPLTFVRNISEVAS